MGSSNIGQADPGHDDRRGEAPTPVPALAGEEPTGVAEQIARLGERPPLQVIDAPAELVTAERPAGPARMREIIEAIIEGQRHDGSS